MKYLNSSFLLILLTSAHALSAADPATWNLWQTRRQDGWRIESWREMKHSLTHSLKLC